MHWLSVAHCLYSLGNVVSTPVSFHRLKKRLTAPGKVSTGTRSSQSAWPQYYVHTRCWWGVAVEKVQAVTGPFQVPH